MQGEMESTGRSFQFYLWMGNTGTSGDLTIAQAETLLLEKDYVLSPLQDVERFQALINMKTYQATILQIAYPDGTPCENPLIYALYLNQLSTVYNWFITGEHNKDGVFHTHALLRTGQRTDALRRTMITAWDNLQISEKFIANIGVKGATIDILKLQRAQKPSSLAGYMMKSPIWVMATDDKMLQYAYDLDLWELNARFKPKDDEPETAPNMNTMTKEIIDLIIQNGCKTFDECLKHGPLVMSQYLHKPGLQAIVQNCLSFVKASGSTWSLNIYEPYEPDPEPIHKILLHQGIKPTDFDLTFYTWITKQSNKRNTLVLWGPSNTGKSAFIGGLKQVIPWGEITNGNSGFNFEGLVDQVLAIWEEPLIGPELAEKCKQIFEGMTCSIAIKYKKPYMLPRTPVLMTTNHAPWRFCTAEEPMFRNRMYIMQWLYPTKQEPFTFRTVEHCCKCRFCQGSRSGEAPGSTASVRTLSGTEQPVSAGEQSVRTDTDPDVGSGSVRSGDAGTSGSHDSEPSCSGVSSNPSSTNPTKSSVSSSSTASGHMGQFRIVRSSSNERRPRSSTEHVESDKHRKRDGNDSSRDGSGKSKRKRSRGHGDNIPEFNSPNTLGPWLSNKAYQDKASVITKKAKVDRAMDAKLGDIPDPVLQIPTNQDWKKYLSYLFHWHG
nr:nonstructural protein 1 [Canary chaphamaparvovirus 2]